MYKKIEKYKLYEPHYIEIIIYMTQRNGVNITRGSVIVIEPLCRIIKPQPQKPLAKPIGPCKIDGCLLGCMPDTIKLYDYYKSEAKKYRYDDIMTEYWKRPKYIETKLSCKCSQGRLCKDNEEIKKNIIYDCWLRKLLGLKLYIPRIYSKHDKSGSSSSWGYESFQVPNSILAPSYSPSPSSSPSTSSDENTNPFCSFEVGG